MSEKTSYSKSMMMIIIAAVILALAIVYATHQLGKSIEKSALNETSLAERVSEQVLLKLEKSPVIAKQMGAAIEQFQSKRQRDQARQRAERERVAAEKAKLVRAPDPQRDHIRGNPNATISLIEYSDFECPYCKRFHETPKRLLKRFGDKVNWVYRHYPLPFHNPGAQKQAEGAECANELGGGEAFWKFTDALYKRTKAGGRGFPIKGLAPLARELGLDQGKFETCLNSGKHAQRVKDDLQEGARAGVTGTPGNIVRNNKTGKVIVVSGARPITDFEKAIKTLQQDEDQQAKAEKKSGS